jgi:hypothetical protein
MLQKTNARTLRLLEFAGFIEELPDERIDTAGWCNPCGTRACYAGHAILMYGSPDERHQMMHVFDRKLDPMRVARDILAITYWQAGDLFFNRWLNKHDAVTLLRQWAFEEQPE